MSGDPFDWLGAILLMIGTIVFLWGGANHPTADASMGAVGTAEYFRAFAEHVVVSEGWRAIHTGILAGPILWSLGMWALARRFSSSAWAQLGIHSLGLGAAAWSVVFVLDGFVAPLQAAAVADAATVDSLLAFRSNQEVVIRLGLLSWLLIGFGVAATSAGAWREPDRSARRVFLSSLGLVVGLWPFVAWLTGEFVPGPFTSGVWPHTALLTSLWFAMAAVEVGTRSTRGSAERGYGAA